MVKKDRKVFDFKFTNSERAELFFQKLFLITASPHFLDGVRINIEPDKVNIQEVDLSHSMELKFYFPSNYFTKHINTPISVGFLTNDLKWGTISADKFIKLDEKITIQIFRDRFIILGSSPDNFCKIPILGISEPHSLVTPELIPPCASNVNLEDMSFILSLLDPISTDELFIKIEHSPKGLFIQGEINQHSAKHQIRCREISTEKMHTFIPIQSLRFLSKLAEDSENIEIGIIPEGVVHASMDFLDGAKSDLFMAPRVPNQE